jgi:hypothetical protein
MANELFFIPKIAAAFREPSTFASLADAFAAIIRMGRIPAYSEGLAQFEAFMLRVVEGTCGARLGALEDAMASAAMIELVTDALAGDALDRQAVVELIHSRPDWIAKFERLDRSRDAAVSLVKQPTLTLALGGRILATLVFDETTLAHSVIAPQPGQYSLSLDTGRLLWEGVLSESELHWTTAFPGQPLDLAAATFEQQSLPSRTISLLMGEVTLRVFPGLEDGRLEIKVVGAGGNSV